MENKKEKYDYEIQRWLESPPKTMSRLKKFYESMVSIHLGGKGLHDKIKEAKNPVEARSIYKNYEINYPNKEK